MPVATRKPDEPEFRPRIAKDVLLAQNVQPSYAAVASRALEQLTMPKIQPSYAAVASRALEQLTMPKIQPSYAAVASRALEQLTMPKIQPSYAAVMSPALVRAIRQTQRQMDELTIDEPSITEQFADDELGFLAAIPIIYAAAPPALRRSIAQSLTAVVVATAICFFALAQHQRTHAVEAGLVWLLALWRSYNDTLSAIEHFEAESRAE